MTDISTALDLYQSIAHYFEESEFTTCQAKAYREMLDFMCDCETADEAATKFRNSPYYNAAAVALARDKALARARAAREIGTDDVALVYEGKEREIAASEQSMHDSSYEREAQALRSRHAEKRAAAEARRLVALEERCAPDAETARAEAAAAWDAVRASKDAVIAIGAHVLPTIRKAECIVLPPSSENGSYSFVEQLEEAF